MAHGSQRIASPFIGCAKAKEGQFDYKGACAEYSVGVALLESRLEAMEALCGELSRILRDPNEVIPQDTIARLRAFDEEEK